MDCHINVVKTKEEVFSILLKFDNCFLPSLTNTITDLSTYTEKLFLNANIICVTNNKEIIGFVAFYSNDEIDKIGYITLIAVLPNYTGKGFGKMLLNKCIEKCKQNNMKKLKLEVNKNNYNAIKFYKKNGFKAIQENQNSYYMIVDL